MPSEDFWDAALKYSDILSNFAAIAGVVALIFLWKQVRLMERTDKGRNTIEVMNFLQKAEIRSARYHIRTIKDKPVSEFNKVDFEMASLVASSFDLVGIMAEKKYIEEEIIIDAWGPALIYNNIALAEYINARRIKEGPRFWVRFDNITRKSKEFHSIFTPHQ